MKSKTAEELLNSIDVSIKNISNFPDISDLEKAYLAQYLVVFISGIYEEAIEAIINEMVEELKSKRISKYIGEAVHYNFQNPKIDKIIALIKAFDDDWGEIIQKIPDKNKAALGNIVTNKNDIAHGKNINVTLKAIITWYGDSRIIVEKIDEIVL